MKLENQVITKEQSQKLYDLGIRGESLFYHTESKFGVMPKSSIDFKNGYVKNAFTISELGQMLPSETGTERTGSEDSEYANWEWASESDQIGMGLFATEVEARADMLIHLLENKLVNVEACNIRLLE